MPRSTSSIADARFAPIRVVRGVPAAADGSNSGVASTSYAINGGPNTAYATPVAFTDGLYSVAYQSTDNAGNAEKAEGQGEQTQVGKSDPRIRPGHYSGLPNA